MSIYTEFMPLAFPWVIPCESEALENSLVRILLRNDNRARAKGTHPFGSSYAYTPQMTDRSGPSGYLWLSQSSLDRIKRYGKPDDRVNSFIDAALKAVQPAHFAKFDQE